MKIVFVVDTSPLMQIKRDIQDSGRFGCGMSFFEQSAYAIEDFVQYRRKLGQFNSDKYFLALTAASAEHNFKCDQSSTQILSSWEHNYKHFQCQLMNLKSPRLHSKIDKTLVDVLDILNQRRFLSGADSRLSGCQMSRIEPAHVILFTASPKMSSQSLELLKSPAQRQPLRSHDLFDEVFRWDQHLHVLSFRDMRLAGKKQPNQNLLELSRITGGTYSCVGSFQFLKQKINFLAHSCSSYVTLVIDQQYVNAFYNVSLKIKKVQGPPFDSLNNSNCEERERKVIHNDKWPIPFKNFDSCSQEQKRLYFGSSYPEFESGKEVEIDLQNCQFETLEITDPNFVFRFQETKQSNKLYQITTQLNDHQTPIGLIRSNGSQTEPHVQIFIMPPNFQEFWKLVQHKRQIDQQQSVYDTYKWKMAFEKYRSTLPYYYNDYLNSFLKYLGIQSNLPQSEKVIFENNKQLAVLVKELRQKQFQIDQRQETAYLECKQDHLADDQTSKRCCKNIFTETKQIPAQTLAKRPKPELSQVKFELSFDPTELLGTVYQQLKRVKIERYQPIVLQGRDQTNAQETQEDLVPIKMTQHNIVDQHSLPISVMGDIDAYLRQKFRCDNKGTYYLKDPKLTDDENYQLNRPYCGNPFIAPGTIGSRAKQRQYQSIGFEDEKFLFEETQMPNAKAPVVTKKIEDFLTQPSTPKSQNIKVQTLTSEMIQQIFQSLNSIIQDTTKPTAEVQAQLNQLSKSLSQEQTNKLRKSLQWYLTQWNAETKVLDLIQFPKTPPNLYLNYFPFKCTAFAPQSE